MIRFAVGRLLALLGLMAALVVVVFLLQGISGIDVARAQLGPTASEDLVETRRQELGYDDPVLTRLVRYGSDVLSGDFGTSTRTGSPVRDDIAESLPASIELIGAIMVVAVAAALALAIVSVGHGRAGHAARIAVSVGASAPAFLVALLALVIFYRNLRWFPATGRTSLDSAPVGPTGLLTVDSLLSGNLQAFFDAVWHLVLPATAAALAPACVIARILRGSLIVELDKDYVDVARMKGLSHRQVLVRHCLGNAAGPALSMSGLIVAGLFAGSLIVEQLVAWPGLGNYAYRSIQASDFTAIAGITLTIGAIYLLVNTTVELIQRHIDPRIGSASNAGRPNNLLRRLPELPTSTRRFGQSAPRDAVD